MRGASRATPSDSSLKHRPAPGLGPSGSSRRYFLRISLARERLNALKHSNIHVLYQRPLMSPLEALKGAVLCEALRWLRKLRGLYGSYRMNTMEATLECRAQLANL